ncbi:acetyltransferase [Streptomyces sp. F-3]|jgi:GNAT superfamily N-acetyltransferase|uniref:N-acetyltransferase domain-containing protein n=1 Tax=Streptomyces thermogriseus TaxID=75292 RepID=A0ABN1T0T9_9ACTN|nr:MULTISPECIES: GNAT family N-acetyltransferase [Streptomyces]MDN5381664.1 GNAT family N-acetyltransferase [Streptomyces sp. LB8]GAT82919.1 acetyltransferase [Streptomyces sp. F-3]
MHEIHYTRHDGQAAAGQLDAFLSAYEEVYAEPPYCEGPRDVAEFIDHYQVHVRRPGMRLILAWDAEEVVGFTYGHHLAPETRWWHSLQDVTLPDSFVREDGRRTFAVIELAVRKPWRRRGIAAALHTRLLDDLDVERVTLAVRPEPEAAAARAAYQAWGYRKVGTSRPWQDAPLYNCMIRELR